MKNKSHRHALRLENWLSDQWDVPFQTGRIAAKVRRTIQLAPLASCLRAPGSWPQGDAPRPRSRRRGKRP